MNQEFSANQLLKIWQTSEDLHDAIWQFCDDTLHKFFFELEEKYKNDLETCHKEEFFCFEEIKKDVYTKITDGKLFATGYKLPIESNFPEQIPLHIWPPEEVNFENSSISANGFNFTRVRIVELDDVSEIISNKKKNNSLEPEIVKAYEYLKTNDKDFDLSLPLTQHVPDINKTIQNFRNSHNKVDISYKTISKHLSGRYKEDQNDFYKSMNL